MFQTISRNTQGGTAHHIFNILFRQLGSAEEPFSEYEKNFEKLVHFRRRKVRNRDNTNLWTTLIRLVSETMRPSQGVPVPLFPLNKSACSPVPQKLKKCFLMFPVPQYCLCSPVPLKIWPLFPWNKCPCSPKPLGGPQQCAGVLTPPPSASGHK